MAMKSMFSLPGSQLQPCSAVSGLKRKPTDDEHTESVNRNPQIYCSHLFELCLPEGESKPTVWFPEGLTMRGTNELGRHQIHIEIKAFGKDFHKWFE